MSSQPADTSTSNSAPGRRGQRKKVKDEEIDERTARNREVQARYRNKQREKKAALVAQLETTSADVERERAELEWRGERMAALGAVLEYREQMIRTLEEASLATGDALPQGPSSILHTVLPRPLLQHSVSGGRAGLPSAWEEDARGGNDTGPFAATAVAAAAAAVPAATAAAAAAAAAGPASVPAVPEPQGQSSLGGGSSSGQQLVSHPQDQQGQQQPNTQQQQQQQQQQHDPLARVADELGVQMASLAAHAAAAAKAGKQVGKDFDSLAILSKMAVSVKSLEVVAQCSPEHLINSWQVYISELRDRVAEYDLTKTSTGLEELRGCTEKWGLLLALMLVHNPTAVRHLMAANLEGERTEEEARQKWDDVAAAMDLSPSERERLLDIYRAYLQQIERLKAHKEEALLLVEQGSVDAAALEAAGLSDMMVTYLRAFEGATRLAAQADLEMIAALKLMQDASLMWNTEQKARVICAGPNFLDTAQLLEAVKRLHEAAAQPRLQ